MGKAKLHQQMWTETDSDSFARAKATTTSVLRQQNPGPEVVLKASYGVVAW